MCSAGLLEDTEPNQCDVREVSSRCCVFVYLLRSCAIELSNQPTGSRKKEPRNKQIQSLKPKLQRSVSLAKLSKSSDLQAGQVISRVKCAMFDSKMMMSPYSTSGQMFEDLHRAQKSLLVRPLKASRKNMHPAGMPLPVFHRSLNLAKP